MANRRLTACTASRRTVTGIRSWTVLGRNCVGDAGMPKAVRWSTLQQRLSCVFWSICRAAVAVHLDGTPLSELPPLILCEIAIPNNSITSLATDQLPAGWNDPYATPSGLPDFANRQFEQHRTLCLAIASAVVPLSPSRNVLLDPLHPQRSECRVIAIQPYPIDPRLPTATTA